MFAQTTFWFTYGTGQSGCHVVVDRTA